MPALREQLAETESFLVAAELVTSRGPAHDPLLEFAAELAGDPRVGVFSITDNPGGNPMAAPDAVALDLAARGCEVIVHVATKDANRNALESRAWQLASHGLHNVLALSGDYPVAGHRGAAEPVFDLDSVGLLALLSAMNDGLPEARRPGERLDRTDFFAG